MQERFDILFETCLANGFIPVVEHLALCSGWDRRTLWDIETGDSHRGDGMADVIRNAKQMIAAMDAELATNNEINPTIYKFRATNYYGMSDRQEVEVKPVVDNQLPDNADDIINAIPKLKE